MREASSPSGRSLWKERNSPIELPTAMTKPDFSGNKPKTQEQGAQDNGEPTEKTADDQNEVKKNSKAEVRISLRLFPLSFIIFLLVKWFLNRSHYSHELECLAESLRITDLLHSSLYLSRSSSILTENLNSLHLESQSILD